jgi:hypothetical protein
MTQKNKTKSVKTRSITIAVCVVALCFTMAGCHSEKPEVQPIVTRPMNPDLVKVSSKPNSENVVAALKTIRNAQNLYYAQKGGRYGTFEQLARNRFLSSSFASEKPTVQGYILTLKFSQLKPDFDIGTAYTVNADPADGRGPHFLLDKDHVIHSKDKEPAAATDSVFEENR